MTAPAKQPGGTEVARYLRDIRRLPMLSREEEHAIAVRYQETRDPALARRLVEGNLRFVVRVALGFRRNEPDGKLLDIIQEGNLGLMHAVTKFDPSRNIKLITYAGPWIGAYIKKFLLRDKRLVRIGLTVAQRKLFSNLGRTRTRLGLALGRDATDDEVGAELDVRAADVTDMSIRLAFSESPLLRQGDDGPPQEWIPADGAPADELLERRQEATGLHWHIDELRGELSLREQHILDARLLADEPVTLASLADHYGLSRERVRQIEARIKARLAGRLRERLREAA